LEKAGLLSIWTMWWCNGLIALGGQRALQVDDVWDMPAVDRVPNVSSRFQAEWSRVQREGGSLLAALRRAFGYRMILGGMAHFGVSFMW